MKHKHHIIPKHVGGSDDPSNLVELTVGEHAEAHRLLWEQYGRWQDYIAWCGLSGRLSKEEIIREKIRLSNYGRKHKKESIDKIKNCSLQQWQRLDDIRKTTEHKKKVSETQKNVQNLPEVKLKRSNTLSKMWEITDPNGKILSIKNLKKFCIENNLLDANMKKVANGERNHHKNWKCKRLEL